MAAALGRPAKVALLKGRSNYLCRYRLASAGAEHEQLALEVSAESGAHGRSGSAGQKENMLARIQSWARTTRLGDLAEVRGLSDSHPVWPRVTSTRENCLGKGCPEIARCHVAVARRQALDSDIVIVNHHLLLADLALKEDGFGDILGSSDAIILDEAHQIPDLATQFFGANVSSRGIEGVLKDIHAQMGHAPEPFEISSALSDTEESLRQVGACLPSRAPTRTSWTERHSPLNTAVEDLYQSLLTLHARLAILDEENPLAQIGERVANLAASLERICAVDELEGARAVEITPRGFALSLMPFDISARFQTLLQARRCAWIFTSATLSLGGGLQPLHRPPRAQRYADVENRQSIRLRAAIPVVPPCWDDLAVRPGLRHRGDGNGPAADRCVARVAHSCCSPVTVRWGRALRCCANDGRIGHPTSCLCRAKPRGNGC